MPRLSPLSSPFLLGFDRLERLLDSVAKTSSNGYPPYNIEHLGDREMRISLAVAGFSPQDLEISLEDNQLTIQGRQGDDQESRTYLHRGIAARQFVRKFVLAEGMEVGEAYLDNGLLHVELARPEREHRVRKIAVKSGPGKTKRKADPAARQEKKNE